MYYSASKAALVPAVPQPCLVLVVSLNRAKHRRQHMIQELNRIGIKDYTLVDAVDGQQLSPQTLRQYQPINQEWIDKNKTHSPMEIGCALSHMRCYELLAQSHAPAALILEDDAKLSTDLPKIIQHINRFPNNWTIVQASRSKSKVYLNLWTSQSLIGQYRLGVNAEKSAESIGYFISKNKAKALMSELPKLKLPADYLFHQRIGGSMSLFNFYSIQPGLIVPSPLVDQSTIVDKGKRIKPARLFRLMSELRRLGWEKGIARLVRVIRLPQKPY